MKCLKCGATCADSAIYCDWCGEKLDDCPRYKAVKYSFLQALSDYWCKAFDFDGRARRKEFWYACIWNFLFLLAINLIGVIVSKDLQFALEILFYAGLVLPNISLAIRRVHDVGKSGYWLLIGLIPVVGHIAVLTFFVIDGIQEGNEYGESTKYINQNISF